jgi:hypothetical protein
MMPHLGHVRASAASVVEVPILVRFSVEVAASVWWRGALFGGVVVVGFAILAIAGWVVLVHGVERRLGVELGRVVVVVQIAVSALPRPRLGQHVLWCGVINGV